MTTFSLVMHLGVFMVLTYRLSLSFHNFFDKWADMLDYLTKKQKLCVIQSAAAAAVSIAKEKSYVTTSCLAVVSDSSKHKTPGGLSRGNFPILKTPKAQIYGKKKSTELRSDGVHQKQRFRPHSRC